MCQHISTIRCTESVFEVRSVIVVRSGTYISRALSINVRRLCNQNLCRPKPAKVARFTNETNGVFSGCYWNFFVKLQQCNVGAERHLWWLRAYCWDAKPTKNVLSIQSLRFIRNYFQVFAWFSRNTVVAYEQFFRQNVDARNRSAHFVRHQWNNVAAQFFIFFCTETSRIEMINSGFAAGTLFS